LFGHTDIPRKEGESVACEKQRETHRSPSAQPCHCTFPFQLPARFRLPKVFFSGLIYHKHPFRRTKRVIIVSPTMAMITMMMIIMRMTILKCNCSLCVSSKVFRIYPNAPSENAFIWTRRFCVSPSILFVLRHPPFLLLSPSPSSSQPDV